MDYRITRVIETEKIIIYKRLFDLKNTVGEKRYFELDRETSEQTGKQFSSIIQVKKYIKNLIK